LKFKRSNAAGVHGGVLMQHNIFFRFPIRRKGQDEYVSGWENQLQAPVAPNSEFILSSADKELAPFTQFNQFMLYHIAHDTYERLITVDPPKKPK